MTSKRDKLDSLAVALSASVAIVGVFLAFASIPSGCASLALAAEDKQPVSASPTCAVPFRVVSIHDADTVIGDALLPFGVTLRDKTIRAYGYDAWEITRTRRTVQVTDAEIEKGKTARDEFAALVATGTLYIEESGEDDPYGRLSARLFVLQKKDGNWVDVAEWMKKRGHCRK